MWLGFSDDARSALRSPTGHKPLSRVQILHGGWPVYDLVARDGHVPMEANSAIRASLDCTLIDPTGELSEGDATALLSAYNCEIAVFRGVRYPVTTFGEMFTPNSGFGVQAFGTSGFGGVNVSTISTLRYEEEFAPLGVFGIVNKTIADGPDGLEITIHGQDRAMRYQVALVNNFSIPGGTSIETAIMRLLSKVNPSLTMFAMVTGHTVDAPLVFTPGAKVWEEAQKLASSVGARLYHDRVGRCVLLPDGGNRYPVAAYGEGDGLLLSLDRAEDSDSVNNVVLAQSSNGAVRAIAYDGDPKSPTFAGGRYGYRPADPITNEYFSTTAQAQQAAVAALIRELGRVETVGFSAVPDPGLDVDDVVILNRPRAGLVRRALAVDSIDMPLTVDAAMRVGCRKSVLTEDGQVLPFEDETGAA